MKYAIIGPRKFIRKIVDDKPTDGISYIELTNAKAATASEFLENGQLPFVFDNQITTLKAEYANGKSLRWDVESDKYVVRVPLTISAWKVKAVAKLTAYGEVTLDAAIATILNELDEPKRTIASAAWYEGNSIERNSITVNMLANSLGLSKEKVDELFIQADALSV